MINSGVDLVFPEKKTLTGYLHWFRVKGLSETFPVLNRFWLRSNRIFNVHLSTSSLCSLEELFTAILRAVPLLYYVKGSLIDESLDRGLVCIFIK